VSSVTDYLALNERDRRRYRFTRDILMAPIAGGLYFLLNPRLNWLRATVYLVRRRLAGQGAPEGRMPGCASMVHYRYMLWNNVVLLATLATMSWLVGPVPFLVCWLVSGSLAGGYGLVLFTVQHNFEHSYASGDEGWDRDEAALHGTSFLQLPAWLNWITADSAYHHVHHLCPGVPNYRLAACHEAHAQLFADVTRVRLGAIPSSLKHVLWDESARRLVTVAEATSRVAPQVVAEATT
jgi:omega-6 fatty acid desaturase (delta-12 desaturase)